MKLDTDIQRVEAVLKKQGIRVPEFQKSLSIQSQHWNNWKKRGIPGNRLVDIATKLKITAEWILTGNPEIAPEFIKPIEEEIKETKQKYNVKSNISNQETKGLIPLISFVSAGIFCEIIDNFQAGDAEEWLPCPSNHGPNTYALRVNGDSMTSPHGRSYPNGTIIFCDPSIQAHSGSRVIAKRPDHDEATFKEYRVVDGVHYLKPLNPAYETIKMDIESRICAVIIGSYYPE